MYANRRFSKSKAIQNEELLQNTESSTALERANSFRSENPFFICAMRKTYIQRSVLVKPCTFEIVTSFAVILVYIMYSYRYILSMGIWIHQCLNSN